MDECGDCLGAGEVEFELDDGQVALMACDWCLGGELAASRWVRVARWVLRLVGMVHGAPN